MREGLRPFRNRITKIQVR